MQAQFQSGQFLEGDKPVVDYYEDLDDKTYYHQKRIHGMKGELNNYSQSCITFRKGSTRYSTGYPHKEEVLHPLRPYESALSSGVGKV